jgi:hypothetical protein
LRIAAATDKWVRMDHTLAVYRLRGGSLSKNGPRMWQGIQQVVKGAAGLPVGPVHLRRAAARQALANGARYVYGTAFSPMLRQRARSSIGGALRELARLPLRFWPMALGEAFSGLRRRQTRAR